MSKKQQPKFLIVCDHGIRGGQLDRVTWYPWWPDRGDWWPQEGDEVVRITPLEGDRPGWSLQRQMSGYQDKPDDEVMRMHHEIPCPKEGCTRRADRIDNAELQTLFRLIATDQRFHHVCVDVHDTIIVITLDALHLARDTADRLGLLR